MRCSTATFSLLALAGLVAAQGFYEQCSKNLVPNFNGFPMFLAATCPDSNGTLHSSFIDLNDCVTNTEGVMSAKQL